MNMAQDQKDEEMTDSRIELPAIKVSHRRIIKNSAINRVRKLSTATGSGSKRASVSRSIINTTSNTKNEIHRQPIFEIKK